MADAKVCRVCGFKNESPTGEAFEACPGCSRIYVRMEEANRETASPAEVVRRPPRSIRRWGFTLLPVLIIALVVVAAEFISVQRKSKQAAELWRAAVILDAAAGKLSDANRLAGRTGRGALSPVVARMQDVVAEIAAVDATGAECLERARDHKRREAAKRVDTYLAFMGATGTDKDLGDALVALYSAEADAEQAQYDRAMADCREKIDALTSGHWWGLAKQRLPD